MIYAPPGDRSIEASRRGKDRELYVRRRLSGVVHGLPRRARLGIGCDRIPGVRIGKEVGTPAARAPASHPVPRQERMPDVGHLDLVSLDLAGREQLRSVHAAPETRANDSGRERAKMNGAAVRIDVGDLGYDV